MAGGTDRGLEDDLRKVHDFVDDDLLSCFLWAAGENAVAQPGWESPSVTPLKGIPLPPDMPLDGDPDLYERPAQECGGISNTPTTGSTNAQGACALSACMFTYEWSMTTCMAMICLPLSVD